MKNPIIIALLQLTFTAAISQNFVDPSGWDSANPASQQGNFNPIGGDLYNSVIIGEGPFGNLNMLWETKTGSNNAGFEYTGIDLDPTKTYRVSTWFKATGANNGVMAMRLWATTGDSFLNPDQQPSTAAYYPLPGYTLPSADTWYLVVNFVKGVTDANDYTGGVFFSNGDLVNGSPTSMNGYSFQNTFTTLSLRTLFWNSTDPASNLYMYAPEIIEVAQGDDSVEDLFESSGPVLGGSLWSANGGDIHYTDGNVGIGTTDPGAYKLAVNGNIHTKEVRVDMQNWPDYVFTDGYKLPTLEEVESHIKAKGHLINIPSAADVEANGIGLGEMNRLLLEKMEEMMLYILQQEKKIIIQNDTLESLLALERRLECVESQIE